MPLTNIQVKQAKAKDKDYWLSDTKGLRLLVKANGSKYWRLKYRFNGKQKTLAVGVYPDTSLKVARSIVDKAKSQLINSIDPSADKKKKKRQSLIDEKNTFELLAKEWWEHQKGTWTKTHAEKVWARFELNCLSFIGSQPLTDIHPQDIIAVVRRIEKRGALDVAQRVLQDIKRAFSYAVQTGRLTNNPARELNGVLKAWKTEHRASLPREELPAFLRGLESYEKQGRMLTCLAIKLLIFTFVRPGELRGSRWDEFDIEQAVWRIPAERMKMGTDHIVPLSSQSVQVLEQLKPISGKFELVLPSERNRLKSMSDNTMRKAIHLLGYDGTHEGKSKATPHGFRATASSILNETGFNPDAIERQLSHMERNGVRAAYTHHARYLDERKKMMQWWADFLDQQKESTNNVVTGKFNQAS